MNEIEKTLAGIKGSEKVRKLLEGIEKLDGIPDEDDDKDADIAAVDTDKDGDIESDEVVKDEDVDGIDDAIDDAADMPNDAAQQLKDDMLASAVDFVSDLLMADMSPLEQLDVLIDMEKAAAGVAVDADGDGDADAVVAPESAAADAADPVAASAGTVDVGALQRELEAKDARIQELEAQLSG